MSPLRHADAIELLRLMSEQEREAAIGWRKDALAAGDAVVFPGMADRADRKAEALARGAAALEREAKVYTTPLVFSAPGTADAVRACRKDVTRRLAWATSKGPRWREGALSRAFERSPRAGGQPFGELRIVSVRRERLDAISAIDVEREGFPGLTVDEFLQVFRELHRDYDERALGPMAVFRIEFHLERLYERWEVD